MNTTYDYLAAIVV